MEITYQIHELGNCTIKKRVEKTLRGVVRIFYTEIDGIIDYEFDTYHKAFVRFVTIASQEAVKGN